MTIRADIIHIFIILYMYWTMMRRKVVRLRMELVEEESYICSSMATWKLRN